MPKNPETVDDYLAEGCGRCKYGGTPDCKVHSWQEELELLREILRQSELDEVIKWSAPCYTYHGKNILMLSALKDCAVISFFQGSDLQDPAGVLEAPGENSRFARYIKFTDLEMVKSRKDVVLQYIKEAIKLSTLPAKKKSGDDAKLEFPEELEAAFQDHPGLDEAFAALTPGRQRGYIIHFSSAKQSATRRNRIEKWIPAIREGRGMHDR